jgi:hypothetical protein
LPFQVGESHRRRRRQLLLRAAKQPQGLQPLLPLPLDQRQQRSGQQQGNQPGTVWQKPIGARHGRMVVAPPEQGEAEHATQPKGHRLQQRSGLQAA